MTCWKQIAENLVRDESSGIYYMRAKVRGKIIRRSLETRQQRQAKLRRDRMLVEVKTAAGRVEKPQTLGLSALVNMTRIHYGHMVSTGRVKTRTLKFREDLLAVLLTTLPRKTLSRWTRRDMDDWWRHPRIAGFSSSRRNGLLGTVRMMMRIAVECGAREDDPSAHIKQAPVRPKPITPPSREDFARVIADIRAQNKRASTESANFVEFLAYSGCRIAEAREVQWGDIRDGVITITGGDGGTKNHEHRRVPAIPPMAALLQRMRPDNAVGPLWSIRSPRIALDNACRRLGIPHMRIHDLRHLFATTCIESGVDIPTLSRWLGHKDGGMLALRTYGHLRDEHSRMSAAKVTF